MTTHHDPEIRRASAADLPALATTLATAFRNYPWTRWMVDQEDHERRLRDLYAIYLGLAVRFGQVSMESTAAGAAAWMWKGNATAEAAYMSSRGLDNRALELAGTRANAAMTAEELLQPHALLEHHWYLAAVGVRPRCQGRGLATRLLTPMLAHCDRAGQIAALETSSSRNLALYERLGFTVRHEVAVPNGPQVWMMHRHPA